MPDNINYTRVNWQNGKEGGTPLSANNLNHMDQAIFDLEKEIEEVIQYTDDKIDKLIPIDYQSQISGGTYPRLLKYNENKLYLFLDNHYRVSTDGGKTWSEPVIIFTTSTETQESGQTINDASNAYAFLSPNKDGRIVVVYRSLNRNTPFFSICAKVSDTNGENFGARQELFRSAAGYWEPFYYKGWIYYSAEHGGTGGDKAQSIFRRTLTVNGSTIIVGGSKLFLDGRVRVNTDGNINNKSRIGMISASPVEGGHIFVFEDSVNNNASVQRPMVVQYSYSENPEYEIASPTTPTNLFLGSPGKKCGAPFVTTLDDGRIVISFQTNENYEGYPRTDFRDSQFFAYISKKKVTYGDELTSDDFVQIDTFDYANNEYGVWGSVANIDGVLYKAFSAGKNTSSTNNTAYGNIIQSNLQYINNNIATKQYVDAQKITYAELKNLRDISKLVPGKQYRITDYIATTTEASTQSAGHQFDIIVVADDENTLNENARAVLHEGDTYFADCDLSAWELKYCLNNDTTRFAWADEINGKGVVYYMKDEWSNECPYDLKNITYLGSSLWGYEHYSLNPNEYYYTFANEVTHYQYFQWGSTYNVSRNTSLDTTIDGVQYYGYSCNIIPSAWSSTDFYIIDSEITLSSAMYRITDSVVSSISYGGNFIINDVYGVMDSSIYQKSVYNNKIEQLMSYNGTNTNQRLNKIIFLTKHCDNNTFGNNCYFSTFGSGCSWNTFGKNCSHNIFENNCESNTFGNSCGHNTFGQYCSSNAFGNLCYHNTFGNNCDYNTFGNNCDYNTFGNDWQYNTFGNGCKNNTFGTASGTIDYCQYNIIDNGCSYLYINSTDTNATSSNCLQNVHIHLGVSGSSISNRLTITVPDRNLAYSIDYYAPGSKEIILDEEE